MEATKSINKVFGDLRVDQNHRKGTGLERDRLVPCYEISLGHQTDIKEELFKEGVVDGVWELGSPPRRLECCSSDQ